MSVQTAMPDNMRLLEDQLEALFAPVDPDPQFMGRLERRFSTRPHTVLEEVIPDSTRKGIVVIAAGLFVGVLLLWLFGRRRA